VLAVDDDAEPSTGLFERRRDRSRFAAREGPHRIEEMCKARETLGKSEACLRVSGHRVPERYPDPGAGELRDETRRHPLGRQGDERDAALQ
jgi:hypothetical protein